MEYDAALFALAQERLAACGLSMTLSKVICLLRDYIDNLLE
jgi:hypothetical protein